MQTASEGIMNSPWIRAFEFCCRVPMPDTFYTCRAHGCGAWAANAKQELSLPPSSPHFLGMHDL